MKWSAIKTILLLVLLAVNLFLGVMLYDSTTKVNRISEEMIHDTVQLLSGSGIIISEELIPRSNPVIDVYEASLPSDMNAYYQRIVTGMTGSAPDDLKLHMMMNGTRVTVKGSDDIYDFISSDPLSFRYCDGAYLDDDPIGALTAKALDYETVDDTDLSLRINAELFGIRARSLEDVTASGHFPIIVCEAANLQEDVMVLRCRQEMLGIGIEGSSLLCILQDGNMIAADGSVIFAQYHSHYAVSYYDAVNALLTLRAARSSLSESDEMIITDVSNSYCINWSVDRKILYLIPAWNLTDNSNKSQIIDGISGKIRQYI